MRYHHTKQSPFQKDFKCWKIKNRCTAVLNHGIDMALCNDTHMITLSPIVRDIISLTTRAHTIVAFAIACDWHVTGM